MPSSGAGGGGCTVSVEDEDKLDAALAIAALSGGSWTSKPPAGPRARKARRLAERRSSSSPSSRGRAANGAKKRTRLKDVDRGSATSPLTTMASKQTVTDDHLTNKLARHTLQTNGQVDTSPMNKSPNPVYLIENETATANKTGKLMVADLKSVRIVPLTPLSPSGIFLSQSNDTLIDPQLMQVLMMQQKQPIQFLPGSVHCFNSTGRLNPSTLDSPKDDRPNPTSTNCTLPLPGSLSTLRDYYINASRASDTSNCSMPSSGSLTVVSQLNPAHTASQTLVLNIVERAAESHSPELDDGNCEKDLSLSQGTDAECIRPGFMLGKRSVSVVSSGDSNSSESGAVKMPGSLSILKQYYSSIGPNAQPQKTVSSVPRTFNDPQLTFSKVNAKTTATVSDETVQNLSKQYLGNDHRDESRLSDISDGDLTVDVHHNQTMHLRADHKTVANSQLQTGMSLPVINVMQNPSYFSSSEELSLKSQISANPLRILPEIKEKNAMSWSSSQPSRSRHLMQTTESYINISENSGTHLPENQRPLNTSQTQLSNFTVLIGEERISVQELMRRLYGDNHQPQTFNLIQSESLCQQNLSSSPSPTSLFMPLNLTNATKSVQDRSDSLSCFSVEDNSTEPVLFDREPDLRRTPSAECVMLSGEVLNGDVGTSAALYTSIPSIHGKKGSYPDEETNEKSRASHPILESDEDGDLPLHIAVVQGKRDIVKHLTQMMNKMDATIDCRNHLRQTPLHLAVVTGDCGIVRLLLSAGASPNIADRNGQNCFHLSVQYQHTECLQCLFTYCSESQPDIMNYEGMTALHLAVKLNRIDAIFVLLKNGAHPDVVDGKSGHTPLYMAADTNQLKAAEVLLALGASAQIVSYGGCSPVQAATAKSFDEMVKLLTKHGASSEQSSSAESKQQ